MFLLRRFVRSRAPPDRTVHQVFQTWLHLILEHHGSSMEGKMETVSGRVFPYTIQVKEQAGGQLKYFLAAEGTTVELKMGNSMKFNEDVRRLLEIAS